MPNIWFTSDPHYYHANVIKYCNRPYADVNEMNEGLIKNWNAVVSREDTVICLGDFSMAFRAVEIITPRLAGSKILVPGNHDFCHSFHKKSRNPDNQHKWLQKYADNGWLVWREHEQFNIPGVAIVNLAHLPYTDAGDIRLDAIQTGTDKYQKYRPVDDGRVLLCGHVHEKWKTKRTAAGTLMINVGVDVWGMSPVSLNEIIKVINDETLQSLKTSSDPEA